MPRITYRLSNRQSMQLLVRHAELEIALPAPTEDQPDLLGWARSLLPDLPRECFRGTEECEIMVNPLGSGPGLAGQFGHIVSQPVETMVSLTVAVVVVTLCLGNRPRHKSVGIQWPGDVLLDFESMMRSAAKAVD